MNEWIIMSLLAAALALIAVYYLRRGTATLARTTPAFEMLPEERRFLRQQARRRIVNSLLMLLLAALLTGAYASGMQRRADELGREREQRAVDGVKPPLTPEQERFSQIFLWTWLVMLLLLFAIVMLAGLDLLSTRRYATAQLRRINADRRAMIDRQIARYREERDGNTAE